MINFKLRQQIQNLEFSTNPQELSKTSPEQSVQIIHSGVHGTSAVKTIVNGNQQTVFGD